MNGLTRALCLVVGLWVLRLVVIGAPSGAAEPGAIADALAAAPDGQTTVRGPADHGLHNSDDALFLHGSGECVNPCNLFLHLDETDGLISRRKDSPSPNFAGGNPWKDIGTWTTRPPPGASTLRSFTIGGPINTPP